MNTSRLKTFAPAVRRQLMEAVTRKLDFALTAQTPDYLTTFAPQVAALRKLAQTDRTGLIERVAYTWFNRLAALRFMDARGWHPFRARVLTPASALETQPELLKLTRTGALPEELKSHTDPARLNDLLDGRIPSPDAQGEVYRHLVLAACRFYHALLPNLFEKLDDETELLLPDDLLTEHSVVHGFRTEISDEDCGDGQRANVEILGWLYQFYISERKDQVMARKSAVPTEDIPAVTQLFTPHWIVRYLVENSLGRLWLLNRPGSRLREHMPYYIEGDREQGSGVRADTHHENTNLQRPDRLAEINGPSGGDLSSQQSISKRGAIRPDQPDSAGSRISSIEHRRGARETKHSGIQELPFDSTGIAGGSGHPATAGSTLPISEPGTRTESRGFDHGSAEDAGLAHQQTDPCVAGNRGQGTGVSSDCSLFPGPSPLSSDPCLLRIEKPQDIKLLDPAAGSGHMLTYAFDLLTLIYEEEGYALTEIPALILRHNLHGLEICPRAAQLAELALVFKAREKSRRFFQPEHLVRPRIIELRDVRFAENELRDYIHALGLGDLFNQPMLRLLHQFEEAKNFGSLIQPCLDERAIAFARRAIEAKDLGGQLFLRETHLKVLRVLEQAEALTQRYHVVVANPPYMGGGGMNSLVKDFAKKNFPDSRSDLFAMFIERASALTFKDGFAALVTMQTWMFLSSYEALREKLLTNASLVSLIQIGFNSFPEMNSKVARACAFVLRNAFQPQKGSFINLNNAPQSADKEAVFFERIQAGQIFRTNAEAFRKIPGSPIAYWLSPSTFAAFENGRKLGDLGDVKTGMSTTDNERFVRFWHEVNIASSTLKGGGKWVPYNKGGGFRKWYGNLTNVVNWADDGREIKAWVVDNPNDPDTTHWSRRIFNTEYFYKPCVTWGDISSGAISVRHLDCRAISDSVGIGFYASESGAEKLILQLLNSKVTSLFTDILCPTVHFNPGAMVQIPVLNEGFTDLSETLVSIARTDWDNFETSWDFRDQPLLRPGLKGATLEASWRNWEAQSTAAIRRMQELETENNRLFIAAYGLDGELQPEVPEAQITLARAETRRDMAAFLSYAVGCMMGRFSLSAPGLILADAGATLEDYIRIVAAKTGDRGQGSGVSSDPPSAAPCSLTPDPFPPDADGIIPVLDGEWFEDDIVARTRDFLRATFGEATLRENLRFIEDSLGKDLRKYFLNDFYKDHLQTYKKRPIYWLVQSPRKGFSVLLYLHRYTRDTMNLVLNRYLRDYQVKLRNRLAHLTQVQATAPTAKAKTEARKEADKLTKTLHECDDWERQTVLPLAQARIELDLDDGVKTNYLKLGEALAPIAGLAAKEED